jgi:hypothetical protein
MGEESPLNSSSINCDEISLQKLRQNGDIVIDMINEMTLKSIENKDRERSENDLVALYLIFVAFLQFPVKINTTLNSEGNIETMEI